MLEPMSFAQSLASTVHTLQTLATIEPTIERANDLILTTLRGGGKLLIAGNGGSAAEAAHFATELTGRYFKQRRAPPAIALSGNSRNLIVALQAARARSIPTIALLGRSGGPAAQHADIALVVPGESGRTAQEAHLFLIHHFCDQIDAAFD